MPQGSQADNDFRVSINNWLTIRAFTGIIDTDLYTCHVHNYRPCA